MGRHFLLLVVFFCDVTEACDKNTWTGLAEPAPTAASKPPTELEAIEREEREIFEQINTLYHSGLNSLFRGQTLSAFDFLKRIADSYGATNARFIVYGDARHAANTELINKSVTLLVLSLNETFRQRRELLLLGNAIEYDTLKGMLSQLTRGSPKTAYNLLGSLEKESAQLNAAERTVIKRILVKGVHDFKRTLVEDTSKKRFIRYEITHPYVAVPTFLLIPAEGMPLMPSAQRTSFFIPTATNDDVRPLNASYEIIDTNWLGNTVRYDPYRWHTWDRSVQPQMAALKEVKDPASAEAN